MSNTLKDLDTLVFILERVFRSHEAHLQEVPNGMEILDFYAPDNRIINSLHIVFDRRSGHVYITGDLGDAIIQPTCAAILKIPIAVTKGILAAKNGGDDGHQ